MIKKAIVALAVTSGFALNADVSLDARLLLSKNDAQIDIKKEITDGADFVAVSDERDEAFVEARIKKYTQDGVVLLFRISEYDAEGNLVVVSEPKLRCTWNEEAKFEVNNVDAEGNVKEDLQLRVVASN